MIVLRDVSSDEDECPPSQSPRAAIVPAAAAFADWGIGGQLPSFESDSEDGQDAWAGPATLGQAASVSASGASSSTACTVRSGSLAPGSGLGMRGKYERKGESGDKGITVDWTTRVRAHTTSIQGPTYAWLAQPHACHKKCPFGRHCLPRVRLDDLKHCAQYSFNITDPGLDPKELARQLTKCHAAGDKWFAMLFNLRVVNEHGQVVAITFKIVHGSGVAVCGPFMGDVYGAPKATWKAICDAIMAGSSCWRDRLSKNSTDLARSNETKVQHSSVWWLDRIQT